MGVKSDDMDGTDRHDKWEPMPDFGNHNAKPEAAKDSEEKQE